MPDFHSVIRRTMRLSDPPLEIALPTPLCFSDKNANAVIIGLLNDDNTAASLTGLSVSGIFVRADNTDVSLTGSVSGNETTVVLSAGCYQHTGRFVLTIKLSQGTSAIRTLAIVRGRTMADTGDTHLDPEHIMPSLPELIAQADASIAAMQAQASTSMAAVEAKGAETLASIPSDYTDFSNSLRVNPLDMMAINSSRANTSYKGIAYVWSTDKQSCTASGTTGANASIVELWRLSDYDANSDFSGKPLIFTAKTTNTAFCLQVQYINGSTVLQTELITKDRQITTPENTTDIAVSLRVNKNTALTSGATLSDIALIDKETVSALKTETERALENKLSKNRGLNLFDPNDEGITEGKYINANGNLTTNSAYIVSGYIEVTPGLTYYFDGCVPSGSVVKSVFLAEDKSTIVSVGGMVSETAPSGAKYLRITVRAANRYTTAQVVTASGADYQPFTDKNYALFDILAGTHDKNATYPKGKIISHDGLFYKANKSIMTPAEFDPDDWDLVRSLANEITDSSTTVQFSENSIRSSGSSVAANTKVTLAGQTNVAKNVIYQFCATFSSFSGLALGQGEQTRAYASWIEIDGTKLRIKRKGSGSGEYTEQFDHGLTISDFINVQIVTNDNYRCVVRIQTKEDANHVHFFEADTTDTTLYPSVTFMGNCVGQYYFQSETALADYTYTVIFKDATKPIYLFGDSYMSYYSDGWTNGPERWVAYLKTIGCLNSVLINACSGMNSTGAANALGGLKGRPKFALWALGMNDSSDSDANTPAANWMTGVTAFLSWCQSNGATPIFGTVPTTPDVMDGSTVIKQGKLNEGKNNWIRNSGYRYVDFAKAYGADANGNWYPGMINTTNNDYVHPTAAGAKAAFYRALADFPEIAGQLR